jgi:hypothetical protein
MQFRVFGICVCAQLLAFLDCFLASFASADAFEDLFVCFQDVLCVAVHSAFIMSAMRTMTSSIFRIADFSLWLRVAVMTFAEQLSGFTAADLMAAFPGIPRSTAYDWISGVREPVAYLQPVALAHLRSAKRTPNKLRQRNPMGGGVGGEK